jgi:predicted RNA-binding Zn-ribbon protein involved in translation (DUF1610 family)
MALVRQQTMLERGLIDMVFHKCGACGERIERFSFRAFFRSWSSKVGDNYAQGFKCQNCGSRYIIPWYSTLVMGGVAIAIIRSILKDMEGIEPTLLVMLYLLIILAYLIYYAFSSLVPYHENRK